MCAECRVPNRLKGRGSGMVDFSSGSTCSTCGRFIDSGVMLRRGGLVSMVCFDCADACLASRGSEPPSLNERERREKRVGGSS